MKKKIFSMIGIILASAFVFVGGVFGVMALRGDFNTPVVYPEMLTFVGEGEGLSRVVDTVDSSSYTTVQQDNNTLKLFSFTLYGTASGEHPVNRKTCYISFVDNQGKELITLCDANGTPLVADHNWYKVNCNEKIYYYLNELTQTQINNYYNDADGFGSVKLTAKDDNRGVASTIENPLTLWIDTAIDRVAVLDVNGEVPSDMDVNDYTQKITLATEVDFTFNYTTLPSISANPVADKDGKEFELYYVPSLEKGDTETDLIRVTSESISSNARLARVIREENGKFIFNSSVSDTYEFKVATFVTYGSKEKYDAENITETNFHRIQNEKVVCSTIQITSQNIDVTAVEMVPSTSTMLNLYLDNNYITLNNASTVSGQNNINLGLQMYKGGETTDMRYNEADFIAYKDAQGFDKGILRGNLATNIKLVSASGKRIDISESAVTISGFDDLDRTYSIADVEFKTDGTGIIIKDSVANPVLELNFQYAATGFDSLSLDGKYKFVSKVTTEYPIGTGIDFNCSNGALVYNFDNQDIYNCSLRTLTSGTYMNFFTKDDANYTAWGVENYHINSVAGAGANKSWNIVAKNLPEQTLVLAVLLINNNGDYYFETTDFTVQEKQLVADDINVVGNKELFISYNDDYTVKESEVSFADLATIETVTHNNAVFVVKESEAANLYTINTYYEYGGEKYYVVGYFDSNDKFVNNVKIKNNTTENTKIYILQLKTSYNEDIDSVIAVSDIAVELESENVNLFLSREVTIVPDYNFAFAVNNGLIYTQFDGVVNGNFIEYYTDAYATRTMTISLAKTVNNDPVDLLAVKNLLNNLFNLLGQDAVKELFSITPNGSVEDFAVDLDDANPNAWKVTFKIKNKPINEQNVQISFEYNGAHYNFKKITVISSAPTNIVYVNGDTVIELTDNTTLNINVGHDGVDYTYSASLNAISWLTNKTCEDFKINTESSSTTTQGFYAALKDELPNKAPLGIIQTIAYSFNDGNILSIDSQGLITIKAIGEGVLSITSGSVTKYIKVKVTADNFEFSKGNVSTSSEKYALSSSDTTYTFGGNNLPLDKDYISINKEDVEVQVFGGGVEIEIVDELDGELNPTGAILIQTKETSPKTILKISPTGANGVWQFERVNYRYTKLIINVTMHTITNNAVTFNVSFTSAISINIGEEWSNLYQNTTVLLLDEKHDLDPFTNNAVYQIRNTAGGTSVTDGTKVYYKLQNVIVGGDASGKFIENDGVYTQLTEGDKFIADQVYYEEVIVTNNQLTLTNCGEYYVTFSYGGEIIENRRFNVQPNVLVVYEEKTLNSGVTYNIEDVITAYSFDTNIVYGLVDNNGTPVANGSYTMLFRSADTLDNLYLENGNKVISYKVGETYYLDDEQITEYVTTYAELDNYSILYLSNDNQNDPAITDAEHSDGEFTTNWIETIGAKRDSVLLNVLTEGIEVAEIEVSIKNAYIVALVDENIKEYNLMAKAENNVFAKISSYDEFKLVNVVARINGVDYTFTNISDKLVLDKNLSQSLLNATLTLTFSNGGNNLVCTTTRVSAFSGVRFNILPYLPLKSTATQAYSGLDYHIVSGVFDLVDEENIAEIKITYVSNESLITSESLYINVTLFDGGTIGDKDVVRIGDITDNKVEITVIYQLTYNDTEKTKYNYEHTLYIDNNQIVKVQYPYAGFEEINKSFINSENRVELVDNFHYEPVVIGQTINLKNDAKFNLNRAIVKDNTTGETVAVNDYTITIDSWENSEYLAIYKNNIQINGTEITFAEDEASFDKKDLGYVRFKITTDTGAYAYYYVHIFEQNEPGALDIDFSSVDTNNTQTFNVNYADNLEYFTKVGNDYLFLAKKVGLSSADYISLNKFGVKNANNFNYNSLKFYLMNATNIAEEDLFESGNIFEGNRYQQLTGVLPDINGVNTTLTIAVVYDAVDSKLCLGYLTVTVLPSSPIALTGQGFSNVYVDENGDLISSGVDNTGAQVITGVYSAEIANNQETFVNPTNATMAEFYSPVATYSARGEDDPIVTINADLSLTFNKYVEDDYTFIIKYSTSSTYILVYYTYKAFEIDALLETKDAVVGAFDTDTETFNNVLKLDAFLHGYNKSYSITRNDGVTNPEDNATEIDFTEQQGLQDKRITLTINFYNLVAERTSKTINVTVKRGLYFMPNGQAGSTISNPLITTKTGDYTSSNANIGSKIEVRLDNAKHKFTIGNYIIYTHETAKLDLIFADNNNAVLSNTTDIDSNGYINFSHLAEERNTQIIINVKSASGEFYGVSSATSLQKDQRIIYTRISKTYNAIQTVYNYKDADYEYYESGEPLELYNHLFNSVNTISTSSGLFRLLDVSKMMGASAVGKFELMNSEIVPASGVYEYGRSYYEKIDLSSFTNSRRVILIGLDGNEITGYNYTNMGFNTLNNPNNLTYSSLSSGVYLNNSTMLIESDRNSGTQAVINISNDAGASCEYIFQVKKNNDECLDAESVPSELIKDVDNFNYITMYTNDDCEINDQSLVNIVDKNVTIAQLTDLSCSIDNESIDSKYIRVSQTTQGDDVIYVITITKIDVSNVIYTATLKITNVGVKNTVSNIIYSLESGADFGKFELKTTLITDDEVVFDDFAILAYNYELSVNYETLSKDDEYYATQDVNFSALRDDSTRIVDTINLATLENDEDISIVIDLTNEKSFYILNSTDIYITSNSNDLFTYSGKTISLNEVGQEISVYLSLIVKDNDYIIGYLQYNFTVVPNFEMYVNKDVYLEDSDNTQYLLSQDNLTQPSSNFIYTQTLSSTSEEFGMVTSNKKQYYQDLKLEFKRIVGTEAVPTHTVSIDESSPLQAVHGVVVENNAIKLEQDVTGKLILKVEISDSDILGVFTRLWTIDIRGFIEMTYKNSQNSITSQSGVAYTAGGGASLYSSNDNKYTTGSAGNVPIFIERSLNCPNSNDITLKVEYSIYSEEKTNVADNSMNGQYYTETITGIVYNESHKFTSSSLTIKLPESYATNARGEYYVTYRLTLSYLNLNRTMYATYLVRPAS